MNTVQLIAVFAENKPGWLARVTGVLAEAGVNIHWLGIASLESFGVIRLLVDQPEVALNRLRAGGFMVSALEVLAVEAPDQPGSLNRIAHTLSERGVSLKNCSGFVFNQRAILLLELADLGAACEALNEQGAKLLSRDELLRL
jgi:hypothetical protein